MKNVWLTSRRTDLKILVIVGCVAVALMSAAALKFWAIQPFHASYDIVGNYATDTEADAAAIRRDWPHRLVQPEWVGVTPDLFGNWTKAETAARSVIVGVVWLVVTGLLIHRYIRLPKYKTAKNATTTNH